MRRIAKRAGIAKPISPPTLRHAFITALDAGVPLRDVLARTSDVKCTATNIAFADHGPR